MVPGEGVEPSHPFGRQILSLLRLPFRHPGMDGAGEGNRTLVTSLEGWSSAIELHPPASVVRVPPRCPAEPIGEVER